MNEKEKRTFRVEKTLKSFVYSILGVTLPFILSLLPIILFRKYTAVWDFLDQGEFLLFSAGLYTTSIFLYSENTSSISKKIDKILKNLSFWLLIVCASLYAIIYCIELLPEINLPVDFIFLRFFSLILFIVAAISVYRSIYIDYQKMIPSLDVQKKSESDIDEIMNQLPKEK